MAGEEQDAGVRVIRKALQVNDVEVTKSPLLCGLVAQLGERLICNQEVRGSSPLLSTKIVAGGRYGYLPWLITTAIGVVSPNPLPKISQVG